MDDYIRNVLFEKKLFKTLEFFNREFYNKPKNTIANSFNQKDILKENEELQSRIIELQEKNKELNNIAITAKVIVILI